MSKRNRNRRQLRQKQKRQVLAPHDRAERNRFLQGFENQASIAGPACWPGGCDASLARPDLVKLQFAQFAIDAEPGRSKHRQLERGLGDGLVGKLPNLEHWSIEEFLWHGLPGDSWSPIDAFLAHEQERFSPGAAAQLRRWKEARIGFFEVDAVADNRVTLSERDPVTDRVIGASFEAISLNIGGANFYREHVGGINLTYVAPWAPDQGLYCAMGYGKVLPPHLAPAFVGYLGLRQPDVVTRPFPWKTGAAEHCHYAQRWRQRDWPAWLAEQLTFPFQALVGVPGRDQQIADVLSLMPATPEQFRDIGLYFDVDFGDDFGLVGATAAMPIDPNSPNALPMAEYRAYRDLVGLPKAVRKGPWGLEIVGR